MWSAMDCIELTHCAVGYASNGQHGNIELSNLYDFISNSFLGGVCDGRLKTKQGHRTKLGRLLERRPKWTTLLATDFNC